MGESLYCQSPDRDCTGLTCGHPLPCPHHTVELDVERQTVTTPKHRALTPTEHVLMRNILTTLEPTEAGEGE